MMKAFSFLTILESLSKKLSILRTKMHSDDLRVDYESITSQLRVSRPFSRTSFDLSRRASHFAAILTILFTIGVGNVWGEEVLVDIDFTSLTAQEVTQSGLYYDNRIYFDVKSEKKIIVSNSGINFNSQNGSAGTGGHKIGFLLKGVNKQFTVEITHGYSGKSFKFKAGYSKGAEYTKQSNPWSDCFSKVNTQTFSELDGTDYVFWIGEASSSYTTIKSIRITTPSSAGSVAVTSVSLNKTTTTLEIGGTETLTATIEPDNATNKNVTWSSSNESVATVQNGVVTAVAAGTANITATTADGNKTATCAVTVNAAGGGGDGDCPESGKIYSLEVKSATYSVPKATETNMESAYATVVNGDAYIGNKHSNDAGKAQVKTDGSGTVYFNGQDGYIKLVLDCPIQTGDVLTFTNGSGTNQICFTTEATRATTHATKDNTFTFPEAFNEKSTIYVWRASGNSTYLHDLTITRPASSDPTCTAVAAPTDLTCSARTNSSLTFGWTAASNASEYVVTLYSDANCTTQVSSQTITGTSCTFTGLSGNTTYYCKVQSKGDGTTYCTNGGTTNATSGTTLTTPTITFNNGSYTVGGSALDLSTLFKSNSNGAVTYTVTNANGTGATIDGTSFTASAAGTATIKATQAANGDYCSGEATATITVNAAPVTPEPEQVPQVGTFTGMGMSGSVNLYWTMPTKPVTTRVDIASATLSGAVGQSDAATTIDKVNANEIKVEYSTNTTWKTTGVQIPLATPQKNVESITFEYKSASSNQSVYLIPFLYDGTTRWVESNFAELTPTEWTSHTSVITKQVWGENLYSKDKTIQSVNFYANPATATSGTFYIRNVVLNQGTQVAASGLIIVRKVGSNPTSPTDGTEVYDGNGIAATCTDNGLTDGTTYHYAAYAHDGQGNYSEPLYWQYTYKEGVNTYAPDDTDFPNPERGFYEQVQWNANKGYDAVIGDSYFDDARAASRSLILRIYYMDSNELRQNDQLPEDFIAMFNADMEKFRNNGMKCILRFAYDENSGDGAHDASPAIWAAHLEDLAEHLQANADVIYVVQAGFLGVWGEWYYSSLGTVNDEISEEIKNNLIDQLLAAVPANRCVQLRTLKFKRDYLTSKSISTDALTQETAYQNTPKARLGHHNDAFLNGAANQGTYENRATDMAYIAQECLYVPIGGETNLEESQVAELYEAYCIGTVAEAEMAQLHYSYLNHSYSTVVTNRWKEEGSYARMSKQLGYRFELESATLPNEATAGTPMNVQLNIKNVGYAPLYNERYAYIVFKNNTNTYSIKLSSDPRTWAPNKVTTTINENVTLPVDMLEGTYDLYLHLPDASDNIANNPKYAVRFANQGIWESETGYNKLNKQVVVTATELTTYTITYTLNGGEGTVPIEQTAVEGQSVTLATATGFSKAGYTFAGWNDGTTTYAAGVTYTMPASNVTLTAQWTVNSYNTTTNFTNVSMTGEAPLNQFPNTLEYGSSLNRTFVANTGYRLPETITVPGATYTWDSSTGILSITNVTGEVSVTINGIPVEYTITYEGLGDATHNNPTTYTIESETITFTNPSERTGYTFAGWNPTSIEKGSTGNKTVTASWTEVKYTVTFNANGGTCTTTSATQSSYNASITLPTPTRDGYMFTGWYTAASGGTKIGDAGGSYTPTRNTTLYAQWGVLVFNLPDNFDGTRQEWSVNSSEDANKLQNYAYILVEVPEATSEGSVSWKGTGTDANRTLYMYTDGILDNSKSFTYSTSYVSQTFGSTNIITIGEKYYLKFSTTADWKAANVKIDLTTPCTTPTINGQPQGATYTQNTAAAALSVTATANDGTLSYQWQKSTDNSEFTNISGATGNEYTPSTTEVGTTYYRCVVTNTTGGCNVASASATITVTAASVDPEQGECVTLAQGTKNNENTAIVAAIGTITTEGGQESDEYVKLSGDDKYFQVTAKSGTIKAGDKLTVTMYNKSSSDKSIGFKIGSTSHTASITAKKEGDVIYVLQEGDINDGSVKLTRTSADDRYKAILLERCTSTDTPEPTTYTVTYNLGGGTGTLPTQAAKTAGSTFTLASADGITKDGYDFAGWNDGTNTYAAGATYTMPANDVTLTAQWTAVTYNIKYFEAIGEVNDKSGLNQISIADAPTSYTILDAVTLPALPAKDGYTATGWYSQYCVFENGENTQYWAGCETTTGHLAGYYGHANYIVKYTAEPGTLYTVTVNSATNGTVTADKTTNVAQGETVALTVTPASGYELGTLTVKDASDNNVTVTNNTFTMPASNVTVSATFTAIETPEPGECANLITYDLSQQKPTNEKSVPTEIDIDNGKGIYCLKNVENEDEVANGNVVYNSGYKLVQKNDYIGIKLSSGNFQVGDKVAIYVTKVSDISEHTYLKIFNRKDPSSDTHVLGTIETPVEGENIFTLESETEYIYVARTSTFNQNPFIKYISVCRPTTPDPEGSYTLTYNENKPAVWEDVFAFKNIPAAQTLPNGTGNVYNGTPPVITDDADYAIYYFAGWNTAANGSGTSYAAGAAITITESTTLYAQWTPRIFDVKYFDDDKSTPLEGMVNTTYTFGVGIPTLPTPTKPGQTFIGWIAFWDGGQSEGTVTEIEPTTWGDAQLAALWQVNCTMPTTTFANTKYTIGGALDLSTLISNNNSKGEITYAVTGGVAATINGSSFTCDRIGVVTVTATQAANGDYCEKIMTATINVAMPVIKGCAQMFTFDANDEIANPSGQKGKKYLDLSSYATINGLSTTGKVGIKDMTTSDNESTTLIDENEIYFPNTNTYLKVENLSTPLAAGDVITIDANQDNNEYIITLAGTQCKSNCITTTNQQYTIPAESSLIGVTTFYIWATTKQTHLSTINICRPAYEITYKANNGTADADVILYDAVLVAGCPNTFTVPAGKQFAGWNTDEDGKGTSYSVGTIIPEDNLILYAQWECIEPVFTVSCDKTAYAKDDEANAKPITVSVTAGNSGGVTYQWYSSTTNDRTTGTAITGAIAASYTPSTATAGTTYYWCEISNSCTTVKTPTIAITVTVTKNNPVVTWSDPSDVNYGGGGYSISATVNDGWNGTLLPSMLTAPTGINLYDIEINGKTITAKFDVTTTFDRTAEKIPFVLTLPETTTYNPLVSENKVSYDACENGGGTEYRIPVKKTSDQQDINPYNRWDTENIGWITWDQGGGTISSESATYNDFSYRTKSGKQVILIYSKIQEVKTIRIYGYGSNATQCTAVSVGKEYNKYTKLSASEYAFNGNTINNRENGVIEISFTTPLKEGTYVQFNFSKNALFYGVELETEGGEEIVTTLSFATAGPIEKRQNDANFTNKATPSNNTLGTITYSSSNANVATVNSTTGEVSIIAAGTTTITATLAPSGCYTGATATYSLTVTEETCDIAAGTLSASKTDKYDCEAVTLTLSNYEQGATIEWWHNGKAINSKDGITINGNTLTTTLEGTYSALVTLVTKDCSVRSNSVTITNIASASATPLVNEWYIKNGRLTPPIALWKLEGGARKAGVVWIRGEEASSAPYDNSATAIYEENGIVYLTGTPPQANETGEDIRYTIQLSIYNSCDDTPMVVPTTITIVHQKNTDKHVLAFVVTGTEKGGFTEGITTAQTTNVPLYNEISQEFDVLATNIYATDNEQLLKEYYSRFDIICITDYPNTKEIGVNGKSYTDAMGALIDIRPIFSMEAWVSNLPNWNDKGVKGEPVSPTTRQYSMLLQCKDHEIFAGTTLITEGSGDEEMYRVIMVDKNQEEYATLDRDYGNTDPHTATKEEGGYQYSDKPALQGFRYESSLSSMLPIGTIEDGARKIIQVGLERQQEEEARMMVVGVNSYAMERLTDDGETVIINTLKYLMKKSAEDISDCSIFFDNKAGDNQWNNPANWGPSYNSVPLSYQGARILEPCIVSDVVAKAAKVKIATSGTYDKGAKEAKGSLTIAPNGALVVGGVISEVTAPNYYEIRPTQAENLIVKAEDEADSQHRLGALIHDNKNGETSATIQMWNPSHWEIEGTKKKKYWSYVAVPIQEAPIPEFFYRGFTYLYDETQGWIKKGDGTVLYPFQGIGASLQTGNMETFYGKLATTDDQDIILTKTDIAGAGQNLIGNSWTAPIQIANFEEADFNGATATVYVYNTGRDEQASGAIGTPSYGESNSTQAGQWISVPVNTAKENAYTGLKVIPAMNAFQVNTAQETELHLNYNRLVRGEGKGGVNSESNLNQPMRAPHKPIEALMRIRVAGEKTHTDMWLLQDERFDYGFDNGWEAEFVEGDDRSAQLYAVSEIGKMAFLAQPELDGTLLGFAPSRDGAEYTFSFYYTGSQKLYLNDLKLQTSTLVSDNDTYLFTYEKGDEQRFIISTAPFNIPDISTGVGNTTNGENAKAVKFIKDDKIFIFVNGTLYDATGKMVIR